MPRASLALGVLLASIVTLSAVSTPRKTRDVKPIYPQESLQRGDEGAFVVELQVGATGAVQDARLLWSGCQRLEAAALAAAKQWRYEVVRVNGKPTSFTVTATVPIRLPARLRSRAGAADTCKWQEPSRPLT